MSEMKERARPTRRKPDLLKMVERGYISPTECRILGQIREGIWTEETAERIICGLPYRAVITSATHGRDAVARHCAGPVEKFVLAVLDSGNALLHTEVLTEGSDRMTVCDVSQVLRTALAVPGGSGIIIAHNHPSGRMEPSEQDIETTKRVKAGCTAVGLRLVDALIIGWRGNFLSFVERSLL